MAAIECCKCHMPYQVGPSPRRSLCPYCGAYGGEGLAHDVARQLILRPARVLCKPVRRKVITPYRRLRRAG